MPDDPRLALRGKYPLRRPYPSEEQFFSGRPEVAGYAADDGQVVLNPYSGLGPEQRRAVHTNEAARLHMTQGGVRSLFDFPLTAGQQRFFAPMEYGMDPQAARHTVVARIISGDPSAGPYTPEQRAAADSVLSGLIGQR
jgi:hypothetical protein